MAEHEINKPDGKALCCMRWSMLMLVGAAVMLYGGTPVWAALGLEWLAVILVILYAAAKLGARDSWNVQGMVWKLCVLLLLAGWLCALYPISVFDHEARVFIPLERKWPMVWGSVDGQLSMAGMKRVSAVAGCLLVFLDMTFDQRWNRRMLGTVGMLGVITALLGVVQRVAGDTFGYWGVSPLPATVFGSFWYHGNAGAFLNLCWPVVGAWVLGFSQSKSQTEGGRRVSMHRPMVLMLVVALLTMFAGVWINMARAAQAVFLVQLAIMGALALWYAWGRKRAKRMLWRGAVLIGLFLGLLAFTVWAGMWPNEERWSQLLQGGGFFANPRWQAMGVMQAWVPEVLFRGFGPGTFAAVFVVKASGDSAAPNGYWEFAHSDHLQTMLEWGVLGYLAWLLLLGLLVSNLVRQVSRSRRHRWWREFAAKAAVLTSLIGVGLHALVDFPLQIISIQLVVAALAAAGAGKIHSGHAGKDE